MYIPYRGKIRRAKVTKFWPGDENIPRRIGAKVTKVYQRKIFHDE